MKLVVAVDGSANGSVVGQDWRGPGAAGWGWFVHEELYDFGSCTEDEYCELSAVLHAVESLPDIPLLVVSDCHEVLLRLSGEKKPPKRGARYESAWNDAMSLVAAAGNRLSFSRVLPDVAPIAGHSVAHYLAFLGREKLTPATFNPVENICDILAAENSESSARKIIMRHYADEIAV